MCQRQIKLCKILGYFIDEIKIFLKIIYPSCESEENKEIINLSYLFSSLIISCKTEINFKESITLCPNVILRDSKLILIQTEYYKFIHRSHAGI